MDIRKFSVGDKVKMYKGIGWVTCRIKCIHRNTLYLDYIMGSICYDHPGSNWVCRMSDGHVKSNDDKGKNIILINRKKIWI